MKLVLGLAGIPREIFDSVQGESRRFADGAKLVSQPMPSAQYDAIHANFFLKKFGNLIEQDHHNELESTAFALVYVDRSETQPAATADFLAQFFPFTFLVPVRWNFVGGSREANGRSKNELITLLETAIKPAKAALTALSAELRDRAGHTPLLLPVRNFRSQVLRAELNEIQAEVLRAADKPAALRNAVERFCKTHPPQKIGTHPRRCFVDDRQVEFHPPGSARHGFARPSLDHPISCLLSGRRRLGAPYDKAFHYDCTRGAGKLRDHFEGCHEVGTLLSGDPHLNISPNDHVRA